MSTSMTKKMFVLKSSDEQSFEIEEANAVQSLTMAHMIEDDSAKTEIPIQNVTSKILALVIEYRKKHVGGDDASSSAEELKKWEAEFMEKDQSTIVELILPANYLNIKSLLDLSCLTVADMISGKTAEQIRELFNIEKISRKKKKKRFVGRINGLLND